LVGGSPSTEYDYLPSVDVSDFKQLWHTQTLDHFNYLDQRTYEQRYWVNDKFFDEVEGPIFLYICGEYTCSIREDRMFSFMVGASHNAKLMALEHRFYGESQPFDDWKTENFAYLSAEQALADISSFISEFAAEENRQVVVVGGSYPGALSAWFREKYPHMTVAAWSSSGVVYPKVDFWEFDEQVYQSTVKSGEWCPETIKSIFKEVTRNLHSADDDLKAETMKRAGASPKMHTGDFAFYFADIFVESVQYGDRTGLCDAMKEIKDKDLMTQLDTIKNLAAKAGVSPPDYCRKAISNTAIDTNGSARQWTYQYCTEFGFYQTPSEKHAMRPSELLGVPYWEDLCMSLFGVPTQAKRSSDEFAGFHTAGSNTIITNGGEDPWQWATELEPNTDINQVGLMADCTDCGHCADLYTPKDTDP